MEKNNNSNLYFLDQYKSNLEDDYIKIGESHETNRKKYNRFKTKDSKSKIQNELKGEENKLKIMLYSIIRYKINDTGVSENVESKNSDFLSPLYNNIRMKRFSITAYNFDKWKNQEKFGNKKKIKKIRNTKTQKTQKQPVKNSNNNNQYSSMNDLLHKKLISKKKSKKNSIIEDSPINLDISVTKSVLSNRINKNSFISKKKTKKSAYSKNININDSQYIKTEEINTHKNNSNYSTIKLEKSRLSNKNSQISSKYFLENRISFNENNKLSLSPINKIKQQYNFNTISPKRTNRSSKFSPKIRSSFSTPKSKNKKRKLRWNSLIIKRNKKIIKKNMIIRPEEEVKIHKCNSNVSPINYKLNNSNLNQIQHKKTMGCTKNENKLRKIIVSRILNSENSETNETNANLKSVKSIIIDEKSDNDNKLKNTIFNYNKKYRLLFHKKIIYDSFDDEEIEETELDNNIFIDPNSKFCLLFDLLLFCLTIIYSITSPYYLANDLKKGKSKNITFILVNNYFLDVYYLLDVILSLFKAYYNFDEQLIKNSKLIVINYINSWFLTDFIEAIPFYSIFQIYEANYKFYYLFLCVKMIKLYKIFKYNRAFKKICHYLKNINFFAEKKALILKIFIVIYFFHFGACIFIFIGKNSHPNWILNSNLNLNNFNELYISAIYALMTTMTTVGYGDITSYSFPEKIFQLILLIFGIIAYSWIVSSASSYINKINNYLVDLEEKKEILNEIKLQHPNMTMKLYNEILRYLKYKNHIDKNNKKIIFDCLPISLKNVLIYEMYKPIITKFIFFKNFDNIDFTVKVILAFRPVIAVQNDIIINEGDIIDEIVFVKKGILVLQLPINLENPKEYIYKYNNMNLFNFDNNTDIKLINTTNSSININEEHNNSIFEKLNTHNKSYLLNCSSIYNDNFNNKKIGRNEYKTKNIKYIKIINVRENEHFGEVLMFTEQRSPLRLKVRSKISELFLLKKVDAVKISIEYKNIWRRINEKSVYNFEQMRKSIQKIIEVSSFNYRNIESNYESNHMDTSCNNKLIEQNSFVSLRKKKKKIKKINSSKTNTEKGMSNKKEDIKLKEKNDSRKKMENKEYIKNLSSLEMSSPFNSSNLDKKDNIERNTISKFTDNNNIVNFDAANKISFAKLNDNKEKFKIRFDYKRNSEKINKSISIELNKNCKFLEDDKNINNTFFNYLTNDFNINLTPFKEEEINQEIYPNEIFELNKIECHKANFSPIKNFEKSKTEKTNNFLNKSSKLQMILDTKRSDTNSKNEIIKNNENNCIIKEINININSSYENFNTLSNNILINDDTLQNKLKKFLDKILSKVDTSIKKNDIKFLSLSSGNNSKEKSPYLIKKSFILKNNNIKRGSKIFNYRKSYDRSSIFNFYSKSFSNKIKKQKTFQKSDSSKKNKNTKNIYNINCLYPVKKGKSYDQESPKILENSHDLHCKIYKKNINLLSQINHNILNSSENLTNPSKFYKRYFNLLISNNKKKDIYNSIDKRSPLFFILSNNFNAKTKDERKKKPSRKCRKTFQYLKDDTNINCYSNYI